MVWNIFLCSIIYGIILNFQDLATNLKLLHKQADQAVQLEAEQNQLRKRPRMTAPEAAEAVNAEDGNPPFGGPE